MSSRNLQILTHRKRWREKVEPVLIVDFFFLIEENYFHKKNSLRPLDKNSTVLRILLLKSPLVQASWNTDMF